MAAGRALTLLEHDAGNYCHAVVSGTEGRSFAGIGREVHCEPLLNRMTLSVDLSVL